MSILNIANDGYFNVLIIICRALNDLGSVEVDNLLSLCGPSELVAEPTRIRQTINRWTELGLLTRTDNSIALAEKLTKKAKPSDEIEFIGHLRRRCRRIVLEENNNLRFWDAAGSKSADFTRGVSWLLAQDVYTFPQTGNSDVLALETAQIAEAGKRIIQNDVRWNGLRSWATFLGFGWASSRFFVIDPTQAIRDVLPELFAREKVLSAAKFIEEIAETIPVLDSGSYRHKLEGVLDESAWNRPKNGQLSTSLSRALKRLEASGELALDIRADATGLTFTGREREWGRFTHVHLGKGSS